MPNKKLGPSVTGGAECQNPPGEKKRKRHQSCSGLAGNPQRKRFKGHGARVIAVQSTGQAFKNGEVDVEKYVKSREFEIQALEASLVHSKKFSSSRAFQAVPRNLRRRTASHNVKRVPKRLRSQTAKEVRSPYNVWSS